LKSLIGYTGFVGGNLQEQHKFDRLFNSSNIEEIRDNHHELIVCAGVPGVKWLANKHPEDDLNKINKLLRNLDGVKVSKFILISTVDVYEDIAGSDELNPIAVTNLHHYGRHRVMVEEYVKRNFKDYLIIRLPAIYGKGLRKNFVYDLLNDHCLHWTHKDSYFQFYHLKNLWKDIEIAMSNEIKIINFNSEPISAQELAERSFNMDFNYTQGTKVSYDIKSIHSHLYNKTSKYMYDKESVINEMNEFVKKY